MEYIRKIPLLLGIGAALLIGLIGYTSGVPNRDNMLNILLGMVIFYVVGIFIRSTIKNIIEDTLVKIVQREEEENRHRQEQKHEEEKKRREGERHKVPGRSVDFVADEKVGPEIGDEDFDSLPVADFIKKELK